MATLPEVDGHARCCAMRLQRFDLAALQFGVSDEARDCNLSAIGTMRDACQCPSGGQIIPGCGRNLPGQCIGGTTMVEFTTTWKGRGRSLRRATAGCRVKMSPVIAAFDVAFAAEGDGAWGRRR